MVRHRLAFKQHRSNAISANHRLNFFSIHTQAHFLFILVYKQKKSENLGALQKQFCFYLFESDE
jgi:hypothetical protein